MTKEEYLKASMKVVAKRIYEDYLSCKEVLKVIEPESFVEKWLIRNYDGTTPELESMIWKFFLEHLKVKKAK